MGGRIDELERSIGDLMTEAGIDESNKAKDALANQPSRS